MFMGKLRYKFADKILVAFNINGVVRLESSAKQEVAIFRHNGLWMLRSFIFCSDFLLMGNFSYLAAPNSVYCEENFETRRRIFLTNLKLRGYSCLPVSCRSAIV